MDKTVVKELVTLREALRKKYIDLQRATLNESNQRELALLPITRPLEKLVAQSNPSFQSRHPVSPIRSPQLPIKFKKIPTATLKSSTPQLENMARVFKNDLSIVSPNVEQIESPLIAEKESILEETDYDDTTQPDFEKSVLDVPPSEEEVFRAEPNIPVLKRGYTTLFEDHVGPIAGKYIKLLFGPDKRNIDSTFGFRNLGSDGLAIGEIPIQISNNDISIQDKTYTGTSGLYELLTLSKPVNYTPADLKTYKRILVQTRAHLNAMNKIKSSSGYKYRNIIKTLFNTTTPKEGKGYQYWDDPNELVDRLRLLLSSEQAGNKSHNGEVLDIIDELREAKIIY